MPKLQKLDLQGTTHEVMLNLPPPSRPALNTFLLIMPVTPQTTAIPHFISQDCKDITGDIENFANNPDLRELSLWGCEEVTGDVKVCAQ